MTTLPGVKAITPSIFISIHCEADSVISHLTTSAVWCLLSVAFINTVMSLCTQSSSIEPSVKWSICFLGCHITVSHFRMFSLSARVRSVVFSLHYVSFVITSHPKRYSIKEPEEAKCISAICSLCLYLSS